MRRLKNLIVKGLRDARRNLYKLEGEGVDTADVEKKLMAVENEAKSSSEPKAVLQHLKEVLRKIDKLDAGTEWQRIETKIKDDFDSLEKAQNDLGNEKTAQAVSQLRKQADQVIRCKDIQLGRELIDKISQLYVHLTLLYQCIGFVREYHQRFETIEWKDRAYANKLINDALMQINDHPTVERLHPIVCKIIDLLPNEEAKNAGGRLK